MTDQRRRRDHYRQHTYGEEYYAEEWPGDPIRTSANAASSGASHGHHPSIRPSRPVEPPRPSQGHRSSRLFPIIGVTRVIITHPRDDSNRRHYSAYGVQDGSNGAGDIRDDVRIAAELHRRRERSGEYNARRRSRRPTETTTFTMGGERPRARRRRASPSPPPRAQAPRRPPPAPNPDPFEDQQDSEYDDLRRYYAELNLSSGKRQRTGHEETASYDRHRRPRDRCAEPAAQREPPHRGRATDYDEYTPSDPYWAEQLSSDRWAPNARRRPTSKHRRPAGKRDFDKMPETESVDSESTKVDETQSTSPSKPTRFTDKAGSSPLGDSQDIPCGSDDDDFKSLPVRISQPRERLIPGRISKDEEGKIRFETCSISFYLPGLEKDEDTCKAIDNPDLSWALSECQLSDLSKVRGIVGFTQDGSRITGFTLDHPDSPFLAEPFARGWDTFLLRYRSVDVKPETELLDNGSIRISFDLEAGTHVEYEIAKGAKQVFPLRETKGCWRVQFDPSSGTATLCLSIPARPPETPKMHFWPVTSSLGGRFWEMWRYYETHGWDEDPSCNRG